jgi:acetamidase/formamidase
MTEHNITRGHPTHRVWDATLDPVLEVDAGDVVVADTDDVAAGQITRDSTAADLLELDFDRIYPLAGPIAEVVDTPNWIVGCFMPDAVFEG